ncbi:MAG: YlcI/YnfO family protein [Geodermatophilaceae bacterium]|jgi:Arc/MetJ-type ribon-helix-helix transcriptional regulator
MSTQIAVRLPDELVKFIDATVSSGAASSRAAVVASAVERELRRHIAARDAQILARLSSDSDLDSLAEYAAKVPLDLD